MMGSIAVVGLGGGLGALFRAILSDLVKGYWRGSFPLATLGINVTGSFLLGLVTGASPSMLHLLFGTGLLGGFTTFSTFQYESVILWRKRKIGLFFTYYLLSPLLGLLAALAGMQI